MLKKLLFVIVLISFTAKSQTSVKGTLNPAQNYSWVVLYQLKGAEQLYIKNVKRHLPNVQSQMPFYFLE